MKIKGPLLFYIALFVSSLSYACGGISQRVYAGDIRYSINPSNPLECSVVLTMTFDVEDYLATDSVFIDWGDGKFSIVFATAIERDSLNYQIYGTSVLYKHIYEGLHRYDSVPSSSFYTIAPLFQYRLDYTSNIINGQPADLRFYIEAKVAMDTTAGFLNHAPVLPSVSPEYALTNTVFNQSGSFYDADGDSIVFDFQVPLVSENVLAPQYQFPDQVCQNLGQPGLLSIDRDNGDMTWSSPCQQGIFAVTRIARKYRNGRLLGSIMADQIIVVSVSSGLLDDSNPAILPVYPNPSASVLRINLNRPTHILISDLTGKLVMDLDAKPNPVIDISGLNKGMYLLRDDKSGFTAKFIKE